ncbi:two-component system response regulator RegX3 [Streptomyces umbrinus]|uniref:Sensory transduction protein RegX3 n=1 Tax=Streptomyces umbrinus TaxID=67370 RepID=A0ABU0SNI6_9ACTN|nr:two-component system response regulator RegX3 [Streptomyces umbrinus]
MSAALQAALIQQGVEAVCATTGKAAVDLLERIRPDAVLLDLGLPDCDGFTLCSTIRAASPVPILVTSARADHGSCVRGLDLGADDYLVKPYNLAEVLARVRAVIRRRRFAEPPLAEAPPGDLVLAGPVRIDLREHAVLVNGSPTELSEDEFGILVALARRPDETLGADQLVDEILRARRTTVQATLPRSIAALRERIGVPYMLEAVEGVGYRLSVTGRA